VSKFKSNIKKKYPVGIPKEDTKKKERLILLSSLSGDFSIEI